MKNVIKLRTTHKVLNFGMPIEGITKKYSENLHTMETLKNKIFIKKFIFLSRNLDGGRGNEYVLQSHTGSDLYHSEPCTSDFDSTNLNLNYVFSIFCALFSRFIVFFYQFHYSFFLFQKLIAFIFRFSLLFPNLSTLYSNCVTHELVS